MFTDSPPTSTEGKAGTLPAWRGILLGALWEARMSIELTRDQAKTACCNIFKLLLEDGPQSEEVRRHILHAEALDYRHGSGDTIGLLYRAQTDPWSFDVASTLAAMFIDERKALPVPLGCFAAAVLRGDAERPKRQGNRLRPQTYLRDLAIRTAIWRLKESGWTPITRNNASNHNDSAIDIAADALALTLGLNLSYPAIDTIWKSGKKSPPNISKVFRVIAIEQMRQEHAAPRPSTGEPGLTHPAKEL